MESSQHVGELKMGVGVRGFEADFRDADRAPDSRSPITMPHPVDDQTTPSEGPTKQPDRFAHHIDFNRVPLKGIRALDHLVPDNRIMLRQAIDQTLEVAIARPLTQFGPMEFALPTKPSAQLGIRSLEILRRSSIRITDQTDYKKPRGP